MKRLIMGSVSAIIFGLFSLAATDYIQQAVYAGVSPGDFGLKGWTQSFVERGKAAARRARLEARRDGPLRDYFPEAPGGWERIQWTRGFEDLLDGPKREMSKAEQEIMAEIESVPTFAAMKALDSAVGAGRDLGRAKRAWVYARGDKIIILKARFIDPDSAGLSGFRGQIAANIASVDGSKTRVVAAYDGVAFREKVSWSRETKPSRRFKATIGKNLEISVRTNASIGAVGQILKDIRYDDLRELVDAPTGAKAAARQQELAAELNRQKNEERRRQHEARLRIERKLDGMKRGARARGEQEVCLTQDGVRHCAWVD
ncbi:hypothetical protein [Primorskyibacter sp. 2E233]|uniref:hypothetical protein n=1 Tax=Primorskyibacter sp. 2E233 TaxID=3413431 RepID=UPI003BF12351